MDCYGVMNGDSGDDWRDEPSLIGGWEELKEDDYDEVEGMKHCRKLIPKLLHYRISIRNEWNSDFKQVKEWVVECMMVTSAARRLKGDQLIQALRQVDENLEPLVFELSKNWGSMARPKASLTVNGLRGPQVTTPPQIYLRWGLSNLSEDVRFNPDNSNTWEPCMQA